MADQALKVENSQYAIPSILLDAFPAADGTGFVPVTISGGVTLSGGETIR